MSKREIPWLRIGGIGALAAAVLGVILVVRSGQRLPEGVQPIDWNRETCGHCQMLVGEPAHAAQLITNVGDVLSFDDPGCALRYLAAHDDEPHQLWFHHATQDRWLAADQTTFLTGGVTPMGSGLLAVDRGTPNSIELAAARMLAKQPPHQGISTELPHAERER